MNTQIPIYKKIMCNDELNKYVTVVRDYGDVH